MGDTYIIQGLSEILNKDNIRPDIDVGDIERKMLSGGMSQRSMPATDKFDKELGEIVKKYGITFDDDTKNDENEESNYKETEQNYKEQTYKEQHYKEQQYKEPQRESAYGNFHINFDEADEDEIEDTSKFGSQTKEEQRRHHIKNVIGDDDIQNFSLEKEREEDEKCGMLAEIDYLMDSLREEGIDISRVPSVDDSNDAKSIDKVLKVLRHKVDHSRYCTFAEEFMLSAAHGLEYLFNGKNMWLGRWNPDLTGWHIHVNRKLRRMRTDTGKIVSHVMNDYDIGPFLRVCLELIPSMFLFSKKKQEQNSINNTYNLDKTMDDLSNI